MIQPTRNNCYQIYFDDITEILKMQQIKSDLLYQDAIEMNYTHEQNTPLNNIITNVSMINSSVEALKINGRKGAKYLFKEMKHFCIMVENVICQIG